jgi:hypothetical protein
MQINPASPTVNNPMRKAIPARIAPTIAHFVQTDFGAQNCR